jgi:hypothetical protein
VTTVAISQPMYFAWPGYFEMVSLADVFVHYDDVQMPRRSASFIRRVQVKTPHGVRWLGPPLLRSFGQRINEVRFDETQSGQKRQLSLLRESLRGTRHHEDVLQMTAGLISDAETLCELNTRATETIAERMGIRPRFVRASDLGIGGQSSQRLVDIVASLGGTTYLTGHGAARYLDHDSFEQRGIEVRYMGYAVRPWPQLHGPFTPFVTSLDLLAATGSEARLHLEPGTIPWRDFLAASGELVDPSGGEQPMSEGHS